MTEVVGVRAVAVQIDRLGAPWVIVAFDADPPCYHVVRRVTGGGVEALTIGEEGYRRMFGDRNRRNR